MTGLPKLPGYSFRDPTITKYHLSHSFDFIDGHRYPRKPELGIGGRELDANSVAFLENKDPIRYDPSLTYGRSRGPTLPQYLPHFALYDQKCLTFKAFFKQPVFESPNEHYRIRQVNIIYFLQDDTITVIEPTVRNCGFLQGRLVRRDRIPKTEAGDCWHWKDLNVGIDVCFHGIAYHTVDTDGFTREYMASQGIIINPTEDMPPDPYTQERMMKTQPLTRVTPPCDDKLRRFLEYSGKILKFDAAWDNRDSEYGDLKQYTILYFLADDTVSVKEVHKPNDGCDPCPLLLRKTKLPKNWTDCPINYPSCYLELSDSEVSEYYQPKDFTVGDTIFVLGRRFLLYDCDQFTRNYYKNILNITQGPPIKVFEDSKQPGTKCVPPHEELALGSLEDSMQNCFQTIPTRPRKDEARMMLNANKFLCYTMDLDWVHPEDSIRKFILTYSLAHGTIQVYEPPLRNSGILGGTFLKHTLIPKPDTHPQNPEYYTPADFTIGARINILGHRFIITGADLRVYRYMQANPEKFSTNVVDNIRNYIYNEGYLDADIKEREMENEERQHKEEIERIGRNLETIKTEREKCIESYEAQKKVATARYGTTETVESKVEPVIDTKGLPYGKEPMKYGIKELNRECPYPVVIGDVQSSECKEGQYESSTVGVKYPETEEEKLQKYYDDVLKRHEDACLKAAKYRKTHECLPGTALRDTEDKGLGKRMLVSKVADPSPDKISPCRKTVRFADPLEDCAQVKDDPCNLNVTKDH